MVSVITSRAMGHNQTVTHLALKAIITSVTAIISFAILFSFIFSVQVFFLQKVIVILTLWEALRYLAYTNLPV